MHKLRGLFARTSLPSSGKISRSCRRPTAWSGLGWGLVLAFGCTALPHLRADGIPEPSLILYGVVSDTSAASNRVTFGTLTWVFQPSGGGATVTATGFLTNINDQFSYVLRVPCETQLPGIPVSTGALALASSPLLYNRAQVTVGGLPATFVTPSQTNLVLASTDRGRIERIDLNVSLNTGGNPWEAWLLHYFGTINIDPYADADHDGMSNTNEFLAGTDPTDSQSRFQIIRVLPNSSGSLVEWSSAQGKFYTLQRSMDLLSGFADIQTHISATAPLNSVQDTTAPGAGPFFYRIRVE